MQTLFKAMKNGRYVTYDIIYLLNRREDILELRSRGFTLQEIGNKYGLSRERIRQIEGTPYACTK